MDFSLAPSFSVRTEALSYSVPDPIIAIKAQPVASECKTESEITADVAILSSTKWPFPTLMSCLPCQ